MPAEERDPRPDLHRWSRKKTKPRRKRKSRKDFEWVPTCVWSCAKCGTSFERESRDTYRYPTAEEVKNLHGITLDCREVIAAVVMRS